MKKWIHVYAQINCWWDILHLDASDLELCRLLHLFMFMTLNYFITGMWLKSFGNIAQVWYFFLHIGILQNVFYSVHLFGHNHNSLG